MKSNCLLVAALVLGAGLLRAAALDGVRTVYIFPMRNALDQYLASQLTQQHLLQVVTDPQAADAIFTDRMGPAFEQTFDMRVLGEKLKDGERVHDPFGGKGALFLVSRSKQIIWSTMDSPKDSSPKQLEKAAKRTVLKLKNDMYPKGVNQGANPSVNPSST